MEEKNQHAMTFDELSMDRSKSFIETLQELKNLRPYMYSAAEYCEKSYLNSNQNHRILDDLKEYTVRAFVNAVDHLGTVASKLTALMEHHTMDVSTMESNVSCINQRLLICREYENKEIVRQQKLFASTPRRHKHYVIPNSISKRVRFSPHVPANARQSRFRSHLLPSSSPAAKTLSWHLESETTPTMKGKPHGSTSVKDSKAARKPSIAFQLSEKDVATTTFGSPHRKSFDGSKPMTSFRSFDDPIREVVQVPVRSKSMLSAFFVKTKTL